MAEREQDRERLFRNVALLQSMVLSLAVALLLAGFAAWHYKDEVNRQGNQLGKLNQQVSTLLTDVQQLQRDRGAVPR